MLVTELNREQLTELKQRYYSEKMDAKGEGVSYGELFEIDDLVSDNEIFEEYEGVDFHNDDFFCTAGLPEDKEDAVFGLIFHGNAIMQKSKDYIDGKSELYIKNEKFFIESIKENIESLNKHIYYLENGKNEGVWLWISQ